MPVNTAPETYGRLSQSAYEKARLSFWKHSLQSVVGGVWIGLYAHCSMYFAGQFYYVAETVPFSIGVTSLAHGLIFPAGFFAVYFTGSDLVTGNITTTLISFFDKKISWLDVSRMWIVSLVGNFIGAIISAGFSQLTKVFHGGSPRGYLLFFAQLKLAQGWGEHVILGVAGNLLVCLGFWCAVVCEDGGGKILAIWFAILAYIVGGLEHIVANFFTFLLALFEKIPDVTAFDVFLNNFAPVFLGNMISGCLLTAALWWYASHPQTTELDKATKTDLLTALASRVMDEEGNSMVSFTKDLGDVTVVDAVKMNQSFVGDKKNVSFAEQKSNVI